MAERSTILNLSDYSRAWLNYRNSDRLSEHLDQHTAQRVCRIQNAAKVVKDATEID